MKSREGIVAFVAALAAIGCGYFGYESRVVMQTVDAAYCAGRPTALVCNSFDSLDGLSVVEATGKATVATTFGALETSTSSSDSYAYAVDSFPNVASGTLYFRTRLRIGTGSPLVEFEAMRLGNIADDFWGFAFVLRAGGRLDLVTSTHLGDAESTVLLPTGSWICLEGTIEVGSSGAVTVVHDGTTILESIGADTLPISGIENLSLGIQWTTAEQPTARIDWDDFVLDTTRVPCAASADAN